MLGVRPSAYLDTSLRATSDANASTSSQSSARGMVAHVGRTIVVARSEVVNADTKRVALATGSALLVPSRSASLVNLPVN